MERQDRIVERTLARIATARKGVATRQQLLRAGVTREEIRERLRRGSLIREFAGVYRVGHRAGGVETRYLAAVYACGDGAVLAGRAAAYVYGLIRGGAPPPEVIALSERRIAGIITRRSRVSLKGDVTAHHGIPITTVARTLVDLAAVLCMDELALACHEAGVRHGATPRHLKDVLRRRPNAPGARKLRLIIEGDTKVVLSKLERGFLLLLRNHDLPLPKMNRPASGRYVDCRWPELGLTVELDSYRFHNSRHAWEQDRRREREARARGDDFRRFTYADVFETPDETVRELLPALRITGNPA